MLVTLVMTDRRLHPRSVFLAPASAELQVTADGEIERWQGTQAVLISSVASACGDQLLVHVASDQREATCWAATVMACDPIIGQPVIRYRLHLSLTSAPSR